MSVDVSQTHLDLHILKKRSYSKNLLCTLARKNNCFFSIFHLQRLSKKIVITFTDIFVDIFIDELFQIRKFLFLRRFKDSKASARYLFLHSNCSRHAAPVCYWRVHSPYPNLLDEKWTNPWHAQPKKNWNFECNRTHWIYSSGRYQDILMQ